MNIRHRNEKICPFTSMLRGFQDDDHFLKAEQLDKVMQALETGIEAENQRVAEFKS